MQIKLLHALPLLLSSPALAQEVEPPPCVANLPVADEGGTPAACYDLDGIYCSEWYFPTDESVVRRYHLCPGEHLIGEPTDYADASAPWVGGQRPILLTPNMEVVCGEDGVPSTDCILSGGPFHIQVTPTGFGGSGNNLLEGITFNAAEQFTFAAGFGLTQNITFKNCAFINNYNAFVFSVSDDPNNFNSLTYRLEDVVFENNAVILEGYQPGILVMDHKPSTLVLKNVIFRNNSAYLEGNNLGFAVNSGGGLEMDGVCFIDNAMYGAPVISIYGRTNSTNVYATRPPNDGTLNCPNAASLTETGEFLNCTFALDSDFCAVIGMTESPTLAPTTATLAPITADPSSGPSMGTDEPSVAPTTPPTPGSSSSASADRSASVLGAAASFLALFVV